MAAIFGIDPILLFPIVGAVIGVRLLLYAWSTDVGKKEEKDEDAIIKDEKKGEQLLRAEERTEMTEQQSETAEMRYLRQIYQYLAQVHNGIASAYNYSKTSPLAARRYAAQLTPYIAQAQRMLKAFNTIDFSEEKLEKQEEHEVKKTVMNIKDEEKHTKKIEKEITLEERKDMTGK
jgi:hypothetical protein